MRYLRQLRLWSEQWFLPELLTIPPSQIASWQQLDQSSSSRNSNGALMRSTKVIYWTSTVLFASVFALTGTLYLIHNPQMVAKLAALGYPPYMLAILGVAKILGAIAL